MAWNGHLFSSAGRSQLTSPGLVSLPVLLRKKKVTQFHLPSLFHYVIQQICGVLSPLTCRTPYKYFQKKELHKHRGATTAIDDIPFYLRKRFIDRLGQWMYFDFCHRRIVASANQLLTSLGHSDIKKLIGSIVGHK